MEWELVIKKVVWSKIIWAGFLKNMQQYIIYYIVYFLYKK